MNAVSLINPFSSQHHAIRDFKQLRGSQKAVSLLVAAFTLTFTFGLATVPSFRSIVRRYTVLNAKKLDKQTSIENVRKQLETLQANAKVKEAEAETSKKTITKLTSDVSTHKKTIKSVRTSWKTTIDERDKVEKKLKDAERRCSGIERDRDYQTKQADLYRGERDAAITDYLAAFAGQRVADNALREVQRDRRLTAEILITRTAELQRVRDDLAARVNELNQANGTINQRTNERDAATAERDRAVQGFARLTPAPRNYVKRPEDGSFAGAFEANNGNNGLNANYDRVYHERYRVANTMDKILELAFEDAIIEIEPASDNFSYEQLTGPEEQRPADDEIREFHCIRAVGNEQNQKVRRALYGYSVLRLFRKAKLAPKGCVGSALQVTFNHQQELGVQWSQPTVTLANDVQGQGALTEQIVFMQRSAWAENVIDDDAVGVTQFNTTEGIDPVSLKWILERFTDDEHTHLKYLMLDALMLDNNPNLVAAKAYMNQGNERGQLMRTAFKLMNTISYYIFNKYHPEYDEDVVTQFNNQQIQTFEKPLIVENRGLANAPQAIVDAIPKYELMVDNRLADAVIDFMEQLSLLARHMNRDGDILEPGAPNARPLAEDYVPMGTNDFVYFHNKHLFGVHGCLLGAISTHIFKDKIGVDISQDDAEQLLKTGMLAFLNDPENAGKFRERIVRDMIADQIYANQNPNLWVPRPPVNNDPDWNFNNYKLWLEGLYPQRNRDRLGEVEISILADLLGIRIEAFSRGFPVGPVGDDGLNHPGDPVFLFGPNTQEKIFLFNPGGTWYSLHPKVRAPRDGDSAELTAALTASRAFWR